MGHYSGYFNELAKVIYSCPVREYIAYYLMSQTGALKVAGEETGHNKTIWLITARCSSTQGK